MLPSILPLSPGLSPFVTVDVAGCTFFKLFSFLSLVRSCERKDRKTKGSTSFHPVFIARLLSHTDRTFCDTK